MIEARELTKRYGDTHAVHSLRFTIAPGTVTVNGKPYRQHRAPLREVGALREASAVHVGRSARLVATPARPVISMTSLTGRP